MNCKLLLVIVLPFIALASVAQASVVVPTGLNPGDQYYLTFVTSGTHNALSSSLSDYDAFVQSQAAMNPLVTGTSDGVQWKVIGSTASENAFNHLGLLENPIYLLNGVTRVATGATTFWSNSHEAQINTTQSLGSYFQLVFTGTISSGAAAPHPLGSTPSSMDGYVSGNGDHRWIWEFDQPSSSQLPFYAMSQLLTVPGGAAPEPTSIIAWSLLGLTVGGGVWRRRRKHAA